MEPSFTTFFRLPKHEKFTEFSRLDSLNLVRQDMELSFMTFFRLSKHEKFTRLDSLNLIRWGKIWTKRILPLLHFKKGRFGSKILEHGTSQKTLSQLAEPYHL